MANERENYGLNKSTSDIEIT